jgi:hypothetical protein
LAIVDELLRDGLVREVGVGPVSSAGGRPPIMLQFDERSRFVIGVHFGAVLLALRRSQQSYRVVFQV